MNKETQICPILRGGRQRAEPDPGAAGPGVDSEDCNDSQHCRPPRPAGHSYSHHWAGGSFPEATLAEKWAVKSSMRCTVLLSPEKPAFISVLLGKGHSEEWCHSDQDHREEQWGAQKLSHVLGQRREQEDLAALSVSARALSPLRTINIVPGSEGQTVPSHLYRSGHCCFS